MFWFKPKGKLYLANEIGIKSVRTLVCFKDKDKIAVIGAGIAAKPDLLKQAISQSFEFAIKSVPFSLCDKKLKNSAIKNKKWDIVLGFSPDILKSRVSFERIIRKNEKEKISASEEKEIIKSALENAKNSIASKFLESAGILKKDIFWVCVDMISCEIDGYKVPQIAGFEGREISLNFMVSFMPLRYWLRVKNSFSSFPHFRIKNITHLTHGFSEGKNSLFVNIDEEICQGFNIKNNKILNIFEFMPGGEVFVKSLCDDLGISREMASEMIEGYGSLSQSAKDKMNSIFSVLKDNWYNNLTAAFSLKDHASVHIFGAGVFSGIKEVFLKNAQKSGPIQVHLLKADDLSGISDEIKTINKPQWISVLMLAKKYGEKNI